jgi:hypothetical protein
LPGVTNGARRALVRRGVGTVADLAARDARDPAFDGHSALKAMRQVAGERARILGARAATLVKDAGATAILPRFADIKIHVMVEYDPASGITGALGHKVDYRNAPGTHRDRSRVHPVREKSVDAERDALVAMLTVLPRAHAAPPSSLSIARGQRDCRAAQQVRGSHPR